MPERDGVESLRVLADDGVELSGELAERADAQACSRPPIVLLHGLTATRKYVVMGSRLLERSGLRVLAYDARGHGRSAPASEASAYGYEQLAHDLLAVLDSLGIERAILGGASMGAHTIVRFALAHPERVAALGLITPGYDPTASTVEPEAFAGWDALARGLREGGVEGFLAAYDFSPIPQAWRGSVETVVRQRLSAHDHPDAVADALGVVPRSRPFERIEELAAIDVPAVVIVSRDEVDPGHPRAVGERYAEAIPGASLTGESAGGPIRSPLAWQGGQLSKVLLELADRVG